MRMSYKSNNNTTSSFSPFLPLPSSSPLLKIQQIVRLKRFTKHCLTKFRKRRSKNRQYRLNIIKQWIQTETNYVRDLKIIIHNMKTPMRQKSILTQQQSKIVFSNIQSILLLSQQLLEELIKIRENWEPDRIKISLKLNHFYPYLKIYSEYYNNYHLAQNIINQIKTLEDVQEISKSLMMDFESYLIKPIQGPLKYELLMKEYWNHMPKTHPDYCGIKDTIQRYTRVNTSNNDQLGHKEKIAKIMKLGKIYSELVKPGRELIKEFVASTFFISIVKVYLFTDLLLITKHQNGKQIYEKVIELDGKRSFIDFKNSKYCNDLIIIICGVRESVHLRFMSKNLMEIACSWIKSAIDNLLDKQKSKQNILNKKGCKNFENKTTTAISISSKDYSYTPSIKVVCIGVYKKSISMVKNRTYYILKLTFNFNVEFCQYIFIRFSQIQKLRQQLSKKYRSIMLPSISPNLASFKQMSVADISLDPANIVAYRTFCIPEFLNFVFRCQKIMTNPLYILNTLGVQDNLWEYCMYNAKQNLECDCKVCTYNQKSISIKEQVEQRQIFVKRCQQMNKSQFCLLSHLKNRSKILSKFPKQFLTLQQQLMYLQYKQGRINYNMIYRRNKSKFQFNIRVSLMSLQHQNVEIKINQESTVGQVLDAICKYFRMYNYKDFSLFIQNDNEMRLLDQDELIYQILKENEENIELVEQKSCFNIKNITQWSKKLFKEKPSKLYFGKYLFLNSSVEKAACEKSDVRYRFIIEQIFYYIHKKLIILSDSELKRIVALYLCLRLEEQIQRLTKQNIPLQKIYNFIPSEQVTSKWILEVINIVTVERNLIEGSGTGSNFFRLIYNRIFQIVENKIGWKSLLFPVNQYKQSKTLCLGINIEGLVILQKNTHTTLLHIPIHLLKFRMDPFLITIEFNELECKFQGNGLFNFCKMAQKYLILNEFFKVDSKKMIKIKEEEDESF